MPKLAGLQKLTLLDFPDKLACTVFLPGCNLRCPYCHNGTLVLEPGAQELRQEDFFSFLQSRKGHLEGVCVSGGEPMIQSDLLAFLTRIKDMGFALKLDTNGCDPAGLEQLIQLALLDYVAMDIKNCPQKYAMTAGLTALDLSPYLQSAALLLQGRVDYEFRTTVMPELHTPEDMLEISRWLAGARRYYLQNFADSGDLVGNRHFTPCSAPHLQALLAALHQEIPAAAIRQL